MAFSFRLAFLSALKGVGLPVHIANGFIGTGEIKLIQTHLWKSRPSMRALSAHALIVLSHRILLFIVRSVSFFN
jgi:hypothetical protein